MALTGTQLITQVKNLLADTQAVNPKFPDADILAALNAAQVELAIRTDHDFFRVDATVNATTGDIAVPTTMCGRIYAQLIVSSTDRRTLKRYTRQKMDLESPNWRSQTAQYPNGYVTKLTSTALYVNLYPAPTATITSGLYFVGTAKPTDITAGTASGMFPSSFFQHLERTLLPSGALRELYLYEGGAEDDQFLKWDGIFTEQCKRYIETLNFLFIDDGEFARG